MIGSDAACAAEPAAATVKHTDELSRPRAKLFPFKQNLRGLLPWCATRVTRFRHFRL